MTKMHGTGSRILRTVECAALFVDVRRSSQIVRFVERHHGPEAVAELFNGFLVGCMRMLRRSSLRECRPSGDAVLATFTGRRRVTDSVQAAFDAIRFVHDEVNVSYGELLACPGGCGDRHCSKVMRIDVGAGIDDGVITVSSLPGQGPPHEELAGRCVSFAAKLSDAARAPYYIAMSSNVYQRERPQCAGSYEWRRRSATIGAEKEMIVVARRTAFSGTGQSRGRESLVPAIG